MVLDAMDNNVMQAYFAWPERLYVLHCDPSNRRSSPRIVLKGGNGPFDYSHAVLESFLASFLGSEATGNPPSWRRYTASGWLVHSYCGDDLLVRGGTPLSKM